MEFHLHMPRSTFNPELDHVTSYGVVVVVGANGSGKTRLGTWIELESEHKDRAHRVSAQRSLDMPPSSSPISIDEAKAELLYGSRQGTPRNKFGNRWRSKPSVSLLNDYNRLMTYLFSDEFEKSTQYRKKAMNSDGRLEPPETKLDIIQRIWESILPNRELIIGGGKVEVRSREKPDELYNAQEMSDGERVVFYLIGECLAAPDSAVIVIDEPDIHLHKSIQSKLWDAIEAQRHDCLFVYLTHDLDFAASRVGAPKICLKEFDGENWDWYLVPEDNPIPKEILLQIVGSRKPILFTEGEQSSLDCFLFSYLYPDFTVMPCGTCSHVIHATRAFASLSHLHHLECRGIVDRDYRTDEEIEYLQKIGISVLEVSEIENLLLHMAILKHVGMKLGFREKLTEIVEAAQEIVFRSLGDDRIRVAVQAATREIESSFTSFNTKVEDQQQLDENWQKFVQSVDVEELYTAKLGTIQEILDDRDYEGALKVYNNKGLIHQVSPLFDMKSHGLIQYIKRLVSIERDQDVLAILCQHVPDIKLDSDESSEDSED